LSAAAAVDAACSGGSDRGSDHSYNRGVPLDAPTRYRVEELAAAADCSVDTVRFYQKRRLLTPPTRVGRVGWYGPEHLARLRRIRELQADGLSLSLIGRIVRGELDHADAPLAAAVVAAVTAARASDDAAVESAGRVLVEAGLPLDALVALAVEHHAAMRALADEAVEMFAEHVRAPLRDAGIDDDERARRLVDAFRTILPAASTLVAQHFQRVLLEAAQDHLEATDG
jgi:DNA-binding transcriptional MerR regulator